MAECGMLPGITYYLSRWYRKREIAFRISFYLTMGPLPGAFGGLLASGILSLDHFGQLRRWRTIFGIEGMIIMVVGALAFFTVTDRPETARRLSHQEKALAISRLKSEEIGVTELVDNYNRKKIIRGALSPVQILNMVSYTMIGISMQGIAVFLPTIIATIYPGQSVVQQQLRTSPPYLVAVVTGLLLPYISTKINKRQIFLYISASIVMAGYAMPLCTSADQVCGRYGAILMSAMSMMPLGAFCLAQASANTMCDSARNSAITFANVGGNVGGLTATRTYLPADAPAFRNGSSINLAISTVVLIV